MIEIPFGEKRGRRYSMEHEKRYQTVFDAMFNNYSITVQYFLLIPFPILLRVVAQFIMPFLHTKRDKHFISSLMTGQEEMLIFLNILQK